MIGDLPFGGRSTRIPITGIKMLSFTLEANIVIDLEEERPGAAAIRRLVEAHTNGVADVAIAAIMASEKQKDGGLLDNFEVFESRLAALGLGHLPLCSPMLLWDMGFWEHGLWAGDKEAQVAESIHKILFPDLPHDYLEFCKERGVAPQPLIWDKARNAWRNAVCDVQGLWSHINAGREVFVTRDENFHKPAKKAALITLSGGLNIRRLQPRCCDL